MTTMFKPIKRESRSKLVNFALTPEEKIAAQEAAKIEGLTLSAFVRQALFEYFSSRGELEEKTSPPLRNEKGQFQSAQAS